jgi:cardiolipin synthase
MKLSQIFTAPNQLTLLRMVFVPFIVIELVEGRYSWALFLFVVAGFSDGLDGLLARKLHQQTLLGQYLDPIADKLLLSTMFLVLSILHKIPWKFTVLVFSRDISILAASTVLFAIAGLRDFRPSIFGKACPASNRRAGYGSRASSSCAPPSPSLLFPHCTTYFLCNIGCVRMRTLCRNMLLAPVPRVDPLSLEPLELTVHLAAHFRL